MPKGEAIEVEGIVVEVIRNAEYRVKLPNDHIIKAYVAGQLTLKRIEVYEGDKVTVELSPYDLTRGRIIWRGERRKKLNQ
ncbi:MAG: translation initiation factor IF-1 [Bacilli bacterium]